MFSPHAALTSVQRGTHFLLERQLPWGEFATYVASDPEHRTNVRFDSSPFVTTFVLHGTRWLDHPQLPAMRERAISFLLSEVDSRGAWAYWTSRNEKAIRADLDDTACVSYCLRQHGVEPPDNLPLFFRCRSGEGLFYTWAGEDAPQPNRAARVEWIFSGPDALHEVCCVVNANVLLYLGEGPETRVVVKFLNGVATRGSSSKLNHYYLDEMAFPYMLSRAFRWSAPGLEESRETVVERIVALQRENGSFGNVLSTSLAACSLVNYGRFGQPLERALGWLLDQQRDDGSWERIPFYTGPYCASEELTTALCVEALSRTLCTARGVTTLDLS